MEVRQVDDVGWVADAIQHQPEIHMDDLFRLNLIFIMVVVFPFLSRDDNLRLFISYSFASFDLDFSFVISHWNIIKMEREKNLLKRLIIKKLSTALVWIIDAIQQADEKFRTLQQQQKQIFHVVVVVAKHEKDPT